MPAPSSKGLKKLQNALCLLIPVLSYSTTAAAIGETISIGSKVGDQNAYASTTWPAISADGRYISLTATAGFLQHVFLYDRFTRTSRDLTAAGNNISLASDISANGRFVAFRSSANNLVSKDGNGAVADIFVQDVATGKNELASMAFDGSHANGESHFAALSADNQFVAFSSSASNLVNKDTNNAADIFLYNRNTGKNTRVSVSSTGAEAALGVNNSVVDISADGHFVVFTSFSNNLATGDNNNEDVFLRDVKNGTTTWVSRPIRNTGFDGGSRYPSISADGRYIAFASSSSKLVAGDADDVNSDIFVYDRVKKTSEKITQNADGSSIYPSISADGRFVGFMSQASNLAANDTNGAWDSFIYDRSKGKMNRANVSPNNAQSSGDLSLVLQSRPMLSADGRFMAFESGAKDLTADDTDTAYTDVFLRDRLLNKQKTANIAVAMTAPNNILKGQPFTYTLTVSNKGPATASQANTIVPLPTGVVINSVKTSKGSCQKGQVIVCRIGSITKGSSAKIQIGATAYTKTKSLLTATAESVEKDSDYRNNAINQTLVIN